MSRPQTTPGAFAILALIALLCLIWGSTWLVIQGGLEDLPPFTSAAARFTLAALGMSLLAAGLSGREGGRRPSLSLSLALGTLNIGLNFGCVYWSETRLPSGLVSVLYAVYPMLQAVAGHLFLPRERLSRAQSLGFLLGFLGVAGIFAGDLRGIGPEALAAGAITLLAPLATAAGTTYIKLHGAGASSLALNRNGMWIGALLLGCAAWLFERDESIVLSGGAVFSVLYLALFGSVIAFGTYFWLLRHTAANRLSVISYVTPGVALTLGALLREEQVTASMLAGLAAILAGVFLVHRGALGAARAQGSIVKTSTVPPSTPSSSSQS
jgi:drug/metabolite transporter (DMT)-like permease